MRWIKSLLAVRASRLGVACFYSLMVRNSSHVVDGFSDDLIGPCQLEDDDLEALIPALGSDDLPKALARRNETKPVSSAPGSFEARRVSHGIGGAGNICEQNRLRPSQQNADGIEGSSSSQHPWGRFYISRIPSRVKDLIRKVSRN